MGNLLLSEKVNVLYRKYLIPTLIGMLSNSLYCLVDVYFISQGAGNMGVAALNIAMPVFTIYSAVGLLFGVGAATVMAVAEGQKDKSSRNKAFTLAIVAMLIIGAAITLYTTFFLKSFSYYMGCSEELLPYVMTYLKPICITAIPFIVMYANSILLRADHNPRLAMSAMLAGNISNMILDYVFVMVFNWGIFGASFATALSPCICLMVSSLHFICRKNHVKLVSGFMNRDILRRVFVNGLGSGCLEISAGIVIFLFNAIILMIADETALAAYGIICNIAYVFKGLLNGFAQASQPIISANHGANQKERVKEAFLISIKYSMIFSLLVYMVLLLFSETVCVPFADGNQTLIAIAKNGVVLYFSCLVFMSANMMIMNYFQSIENGVISTILALCKGVIFVLLGLALMVPFLSLNGVWLSAPFSEGATFLMGILMYKKMRKRF